MRLTACVKLSPTPQQILLINETGQEYISLVNDIVDYALGQGFMPKLSSASVNAKLPSALRDQCRLDAKSVYKKCLKTQIHHVLKKPVIIWNNQNYQIRPDCIELPFWVDGKSKRMPIKAFIPEDLLQTLMSSKLGTLRITKKNGRFVAQIAYERTEASPSNSTKTMVLTWG